MRRLFSVFELAETFIARGEKLPSFMPALLNNNTGAKLPDTAQPATSPLSQASTTLHPQQRQLTGDDYAK